MKKLQIKDLTPEILAEVSALENPEAVVDYFAAKDFEVSKEAAARLLEESKKDGVELSDESLKQVAGGFCGGSPSGTRS